MTVKEKIAARNTPETRLSEIAFNDFFSIFIILSPTFINFTISNLTIFYFKKNFIFIIWNKYFYKCSFVILPLGPVLVP